MNSKAKPKISNDMGISESSKNIKFLDHPSHEFIQSSFDSVFARFGASFKTKDSAVSDNSSTRVQSLAPKEGAENLEELDFGLGLANDPSSEVSGLSDEGLDLGGNDDMELSLGDDSQPTGSFSGGDDELTLGDDLNLDEDVMAKLAEIDEIMEADATNTMLRPGLDQLQSDDEAGLDLGGDEAGLDLGGDEAGLDLGGDEAGLDLGGDEAGLDLGGDEAGLDLGGDEAGLDLGGDEAGLDLGGDDSGLDLSGDSVSDFGEELSDSFDLGSEETVEDTMFASPIESSAPKKKPLPQAPKITQDSSSLDDEEEFSFTTNVDLSEEHNHAPLEAKANTESMPQQKSKPETEVSTHSASTPQERSAYKEVVGNYNHELERLQATLNHLRMDREGLVKKITELEEEKIQSHRSQLSIKAELDEKKIEIQIMKKRMGEETQDLKYQFELEQERRKLAEEKAKAFQTEAISMQQKVKLEIKKVSSRERELEQRLELLKVDAETQIRHRDMKILELKRKIDAMEFDIDTLTANEQRNMGDKGELEDKLDKAIKTLRAAIGILETDDPKIATLEKLKKNLDV